LYPAREKVRKRRLFFSGGLLFSKNTGKLLINCNNFIAFSIFFLYTFYDHLIIYEKKLQLNRFLIFASGYRTPLSFSYIFT